MTTVADFIVESLVASGVTRVYGLSGDSLNGFTDALRRNGKITWVHVRHEENAALSAAADAAITGELAVCVGSCGPGNLHLINGLFDAHRTRVPVLALAAQVPGSEIGSEYFQETHPQEIFRECSAYRELIARPEDAPRILGVAMRSALEQRDVAVLVIPGEVLLGKVDGGLEPLAITATRSSVLPDDASIGAAVDLLDGTDKVTILAGAGCADAHDEVVELAARLKAPVVHALRGKEYLEHDNPCDVGLTGLLGFASGYKAIEECDVLLMLGTDFPYRQFYPEHAKVIQVDIRGQHLGRRAALTLGLTGDVKSTARALLGKVAAKTSATHLDRAIAHYRRTRKSLDDLAVNDRDRTPVHPQYVARLVNELADDDAIFTTDVGSPVVWASRYLAMNGRRRLLGSFNHGSMGVAIPHAIGAQAVDPGRQVVALAGDGGLTMSFGELWTAVQMRLPIKIVVFNNGALAFVELEMKAVGIVNYGTDLLNPRLAPVAAAVGFDAHRVEHPSELEPALRAAFAHPGPAFVEVMTARQELSIPPAITLEQAKGFTLFAIRTILSGRGEELLDLVTTNVARRILQ